jgi:exosortase O
MQTFVGYPMRLLTAAIVRDGLTAAGVSSIGIDTILVLENGVSQVDLPCSGVKSLWTGMLFLIAATWIERRRFNLRWLLIALVFASLLFTANLARVGVLVVVGQVAGWWLVAEMLHVPFCGHNGPSHRTPGTHTTSSALQTRRVSAPTMRSQRSPIRSGWRPPWRRPF